MEQPVLQVELGLRYTKAGHWKAETAFLLLFCFLVFSLQGFQSAWPIHFSYSCHVLGMCCIITFLSQQNLEKKGCFKRKAMLVRPLG